MKMQTTEWENTFTIQKKSFRLYKELLQINVKDSPI